MDPTFDTATAVPALPTSLTRRDRLGALRVRLGIGRDRYLVEPGLYRIGDPDRSAPVLVTANYKLTVDTVRSSLAGRDVWLLVLDTKGVNVWCAAGKGTFGTEELILRLLTSGVQERIDHKTLVLPQLGAPGVSAHTVRAATGFRVLYGPVRIEDLPEYLDADLRATEGMRRVRFGMRDRFVVTGVELAVLWDRRVLGAAVALCLAALLGVLSWPAALLALAAGLTGVLAGGLLVPVALPWVPGRTFAAKGALAGALAAAALLGVAGTRVTVDVWGGVALMLGVTSLASFTAMNYTGSSTFTSLSGVLWEMRRAVPLQVTGAGLALIALVTAAIS